ncbi:MAG: ABC transporter permease, partial [Spirochaetaceae bacterium]|nr:ABC transporter permease [Spirochaetaceae bacterium]
MKKISWIFHVAKRYFMTKRKEKGHTASILSVMGIAVGVMTLITVIAVMNGFQQG